MNKILAMREKRAQLWDAAKAFLDSHRKEDGTISAEDAQIYDKMEADVMNMGKEIERLERQESIDIEMSKATSTPIRDSLGNPEIKDTKTGRASTEYKDSFWHAMKDRVLGANFMNALTVGTDSEGGYLAPDEFEKTLVQALNDQNIFRQLAHTINTSSGDRLIPIAKTHGTANWMTEGGAYTASDEVFDQVTLGAYKLGTLIQVTEELLNDSVFNIESYIAAEFARRIAVKEEEAFVIGDGSGKPTGIFHATAGADADVETATAAKITFDDVIDLVHSVRAPYRPRAVFLTNDSTIKELRKVKDLQGQYLWQPSVQLGQPDRILNIPVYTSVFVPEMTANNAANTGAKIMAYGDFSYYWIADRQGRTFRRLNELYAANGYVGFLSSERVDGKLVLDEAIKCLKLK